jgi:homoserine dehydrogenase
VLGLPTQALQSLPRVSKDDVQSEWYLRMVVSDQPGAMADITRLLGNEGISIESLIQRPPKSGAKEVSVVIITDRASGSGIQRAVDAIEQLEALAGSITMLRVEAFEGS